MRNTLFALICVVIALPIASGAEGSTPPAPQAGKRGDFKISFTQRSAWSTPDVMSKRLSPQAMPEGPDYDLSKEEFFVHVPVDYKPGQACGLFVFISAGESGGLDETWRAVIDKRHLIWVGAEKAGNERSVAHRMGLALDAVFNMKPLYTLDDERIYVGGASGGGRVSSNVAPHYPDVFQGGFYMIGCNYFRPIPTDHGDNTYWPPNSMPPSSELLQLARQRSRFVLLTGEKDFNRENTLAVFEKGYKKDNFAHVTYLEVPGMEHRQPPAEWFEKAIALLDGPLIDAAKTVYEQGVQFEKTEKFGAAMAAYAKAAARAGGQEFSKDAATRFAALKQRHDEQVAAAQRDVDAKKYFEAIQTLELVVGQYNSTDSDEAAKLLTWLRHDPAVQAASKAALSQAEQRKRESTADAALKSALELAAKDLPGGYQSLREVAAKHTGTPAAASAAADADKIWADPAKRKRIEDVTTTQAAGKFIRTARNFINNGMTDQAREQLEKVVKDFPGSPAEKEARELLKTLGK